MSLNTVFLVGNLGGPPEMRRTAAGKSVCTFSVATSHWDKRTRKEVADWHRVVAWERTAETCHRYLEKGSKVAIEGRLRSSSWTAPDGTRRSRVEVAAMRVIFLTPKRQRAGGAAVADGPPVGQGVAAATPARAKRGANLGEIDDIPF